MLQRTLLFEWEDMPWFPGCIRAAMMDYLRFTFEWLRFYEPVTPVVAAALNQCSAATIIDLCSGAGGPVVQLVTRLQQHVEKPLRLILTDKFPDVAAYQAFSRQNKDVSYSQRPVDATAVPAYMKGFRTIFSGIHHFDAFNVQAILQDAIKAGQGIAIVDGSRTKVGLLLLVNFLQLLFVPLVTPWIKPFKWSRLVFTYLIPLVPLCVCWDGFVSIIRLYRHPELKALSSIDRTQSFEWKSGVVTNWLGVDIAWLTGTPKLFVEKM